MNRRAFLAAVLGGGGAAALAPLARLLPAPEVYAGVDLAKGPDRTVLFVGDQSFDLEGGLTYEGLRRAAERFMVPGPYRAPTWWVRT